MSTTDPVVSPEPVSLVAVSLVAVSLVGGWVVAADASAVVSVEAFSLDACLVEQADRAATSKTDSDTTRRGGA